MLNRAEQVLCEVTLDGRRAEFVLRFDVQEGDSVAAVSGVLVERFSGYLRGESYGLPEGGTDLHRRIWAEVQRIPFGETRLLSEVAEAIPTSAQTVHAAFRELNGDLVVPWHRVVQKNGWMTDEATCRTQATLLFLEGHHVRRHGKSYRLYRPR